MVSCCHTSREFHQLIPANKDFKLVSAFFKVLQINLLRPPGSKSDNKQLRICVGFIYWTAVLQLTPPSLRLHEHVFAHKRISELCLITGQMLEAL